jgi:antitoxin component of RelBE/YafQ-DinJ toxin-antitoxin module
MQNNEALRLRLSGDMKIELQKLADKENRKLSDYIRLELLKIIEKETKRKKN